MDLIVVNKRLNSGLTELSIGGFETRTINQSIKIKINRLLEPKNLFTNNGTARSECFESNVSTVINVSVSLEAFSSSY